MPENGLKESKVTIVMYHFVRDLVHSRYPQIKGLDVRLFAEQLSYLQKHYHLITMEWLLEALEGNEALPPHAALLTFDDGYIDHFTHVFPLLYDRKVQGSFYAPGKAISENKVLDVNKIHFILAATTDLEKLIRKIFTALDSFRDRFQLESNDYYFGKLAVASRLDSKEVIFVKRLLQVELPEALRQLITNQLFEELVGVDEATFSRELYANKEQLRCMLQNGMHIGHHSYDHYWLNHLQPDQQREEISKGCAFLQEIGVDMNSWTMCYPYGGYNESLLRILADFKCRLALTTHVDVADITRHPRYELPRLDTNDLPKEAAAPVNRWYQTSSVVAGS